MRIKCHINPWSRQFVHASTNKRTSKFNKNLGSHTRFVCNDNTSYNNKNDECKFFNHSSLHFYVKWIEFFRPQRQYLCCNASNLSELNIYLSEQTHLFPCQFWNCPFYSLRNPFFLSLLLHSAKWYTVILHFAKPVTLARAMKYLLDFLVALVEELRTWFQPYFLPGSYNRLYSQDYKERFYE